jgi:hypothetical protein
MEQILMQSPRTEALWGCREVQSFTHPTRQSMLRIAKALPPARTIRAKRNVASFLMKVYSIKVSLINKLIEHVQATPFFFLMSRDRRFEQLLLVYIFNFIVLSSLDEYCHGESVAHAGEKRRLSSFAREFS